MITPQPVNRFKKIFSNKHVILPVIHVSSEEQAMRNVDIVMESDADGIFLINTGINSTELIRIHEKITGYFQGLWVGVNCVGLDPITVFSHIPVSMAGVWTDNARIAEGERYPFDADEILEAIDASGWKGLYFGGVAFKYQRRVNNLRSAARNARDYMDVVTTSGPRTGLAADIEKIKIMKKALDDFPLAIASGITPENVTDYLPYSDCYLVSTGISRNFEDFDPNLVELLVQTVRKYDQEN